MNGYKSVWGRTILVTDLRQKTHFAARGGGQRSYLKSPDCEWDATGRDISIRQENESFRQFQTMHSLDDTAENNPSQSSWRAGQHNPSRLSFSKQIGSALLITSRSRVHQSLLQLQQPPYLGKKSKDRQRVSGRNLSLIFEGETRQRWGGHVFALSPRSVKSGVQHLWIVVDTKKWKPVGTAGSQALADICRQKRPLVFLYETLALGRAGHKLLMSKSYCQKPP